MSVTISAVTFGSCAEKAGILPNDILVSINGNDIVDVLDYRFYQNEKRLKLVLVRDNKAFRVKIKKDEFEEIGLDFETYLMDKQHRCKNNCIFCFIDQLPEGMRESLYFKDDDSRLSFLFGNYITLTNLTDHEVKRIIKMHISPVNISVHTTNPELRVKMMKNRFAGESLKIIDKLSKAGISLNFQLVLCPGYNDGDELRRSLSDLLNYKSVSSIACVPVGLTKHRDGLEPLTPFNKQTAGEVIDIINEFGDKCEKEKGERICYPSDEFYLLAERELPEASYYGDFLQLENGVGLWSLLKDESTKALADTKESQFKSVSIVTGTLAYPLLRGIADMCETKWQGFKCYVYPIINNFFGESITVSGLVTGGDIIEQLKDKPLGEKMLIPSSMLRQGEQVFLDDVTVTELEKALNIKTEAIANDGYELINALASIE